eukprot:scaffold7316_cov123-Cylindrotheca_fusiformis.AAC.14
MMTYITSPVSIRAQWQISTPIDFAPVNPLLWSAFPSWPDRETFGIVEAFSPRMQTEQSQNLRIFLGLNDGRDSCDSRETAESLARRGLLSSALAGWVLVGDIGAHTENIAGADDSPQVSEEELDSLYDNPAMPRAPEERSGLVVLRVAEVAQFQEKILRSIASGELQGVKVSPMQFVFGTQILLENSNLDGNLKYMISEEIPKNKRSLAVGNAVTSMNLLQGIMKYASSIQRDFETDEMVQLADMYLRLRINLNQFYEYLPDKEKDKYYGYFVAVTKYERKTAEGVYNPDIDRVIKLD